MTSTSTSTSTYVKRLTKAERTRLRPTVDAQALERFFDATPPGFHRFFFLACLVDLTPDEVTALGEQIAAMVPARRHRALGGLLSSELEALWLPVDPSANGA